MNSVTEMNEILDKIKRNGLSFDGKLPACCMLSDGTYRLDNGGGRTDGFYIGVFILLMLFRVTRNF